jgi:hypothetical protein
MMKKWTVGLALVVLLSSCADFFTNSWGKNAARDPGTIKVTASNVKELLKEARGDTKTSRGILDKIAEELKGNPNPTLQAAAVTAANQASGLGTTVLDKMDLLVDGNTPDEEVLNDLLKDIQNKTKGNDLVGISNAVTGSLPVTTSGKPAFAGDFVNTVSESDLTLLTLTLVLAEAEKKGQTFEAYIETWTEGQKSLDSGTGLSDSEKVIAAAANYIIAKDGTLGGMLSGLFAKDE